MAVGYVLITTRPAKEMMVYDELRKCRDVCEVHPLFGEYDIIAKIDTENTNGVGTIVSDKIRLIEGIKDTKTLLGIAF